MAGMSPSEREKNGFEGMKTSIRSISSEPGDWVVLKRAVFWTAGNANCMKKKISRPRTQINSRMAATVLRNLRASS